MKKNLLIVGLGLLGASLALALRGKNYRRMGWARKREVCDWALANDAIEETGTLSELLKKADLVVLAVPVPAAIAFLREHATEFKPGAIVTDLGSTKRSVLRIAANPELNHIHYVGSHPMAGTEKSGHLAAFPTLYGHADVFICARDWSDPAILEVEALWREIGTHPVRIEADKHDKLVAHTSHVAHVLASALTCSVLGDGDKMDNFAGCAGGFRDTSRTASSNPVMWREIIEDNRDAVLQALDRFDREYGKFRRMIVDGDFDGFEKEFARGRALRGEWLEYEEKGKKNGRSSGN